MTRWQSSGPGAIDALSVAAQAQAQAWYEWRLDPNSAPSIGPVNVPDVALMFAKPRGAQTEIPDIARDVPIDDPRFGSPRY